MSNLYKTVKHQQAEIKSLKTAVARLENELELVRALVLAQQERNTVPFRKLGPYYGEPSKKSDDHDWWKKQPWVIAKSCANSKSSLGAQIAEIHFDEVVNLQLNDISPKNIKSVWVKELGKESSLC